MDTSTISDETNIDPLQISDKLTSILQWTFFTGLCQSVDIFGMVTNIINIICFMKQGFNDPVTISLLGLSVSDLGCLTTLVCSNWLLLSAEVSPVDLTFDPLDISYLVNLMPHLAFATISSWITAIITLERCLCIVAPLQVKSIITQKRMTAIIVGVFATLFLSGAPVYTVNGLGMKFSMERNTTILGIVSMEGREMVETITFAINSFLLPSTAFVIIIVCTVILVFKLGQVTRWRQKSTNNMVADVSSRNQKVAKMVVIISALFISCFIPMSIVMLTVAFQPQFSLKGKYKNIGLMFGSFGFLIESINSSANIFIYYHMSSKYRETFNAIFRKGRVEITGP